MIGMKSNIVFLYDTSYTVLEQLPPRKIAPTIPKTNPNRGPIFIGGNFWLPSNPKTNPNLDSNFNANRGTIVRIPSYA